MLISGKLYQSKDNINYYRGDIINMKNGIFELKGTMRYEYQFNNNDTCCFVGTYDIYYKQICMTYIQHVFLVRNNLISVTNSIERHMMEL